MSANPRVLRRENSAPIGRQLARRGAHHRMASPIAEDLAMLLIGTNTPAVLNDGWSSHGALNDALETRVKLPSTGRQN